MGSIKLLSWHPSTVKCKIYSRSYFDEISHDTGKFCFGIQDTLQALTMGAIETLIVWEIQK